MMKDFVFPILSLSLICLVMAGALASVNNVTNPLIAEAADRRAVEAMRSIIPEADEFAAIDREDMPEAVVTAYRASNDAGYIFIVSTRGFGGEMHIMSGISSDGNFIASAVLSHSETISFANRVFAIKNYYEARGQSLLEVDAIAGATRTLEAYQNALTYAHEAFEVLRGGSQ